MRREAGRARSADRGGGSTGETGPWLFHPDGSHEIGIRAGDGYSMRPAGSDLDAFRRLFHRLEAKEPDRFVVYRHSYRTELTRGSCADPVPRSESWCPRGVQRGTGFHF